MGGAGRVRGLGLGRELTPGARPDLESCMRTLMVSRGWQQSYITRTRERETVESQLSESVERERDCRARGASCCTETGHPEPAHTTGHRRDQDTDVPPP